MTATHIYLPDVTRIPFGPDYPYSTANVISHGIATFVTPSGYTFSVDAEDAAYVSQYRWNVISIGARRTARYVVRNIRSADGKYHGQVAYLHRDLMGLKDRALTVDHENGDGLDNRRVNLRIATHAQNCANKKKCVTKKSSRFKGVYRRGDRWFAKVSVRGRNVWLGSFDDEQDAARAYNTAARAAFGSFAKLNVIEEEALKAA